MSAIVMLLIVIAIILYGAFALFLVSFVRNHAQKSIYKWLTVIFVILLPTWDVVLGKIVYSIACRYVPKVAIYETAETDGIYYEGMYDYIYELDRIGNEPLSERIQVGTISDVFREKYSYAEAKVTKRHPYIVADYSIAIPPVYYHCTRLPPDPRRPQFQRMSCVVVDQPMSRYVVKETHMSLATTGIYKKKIFNRETGNLMAEYNKVCMAKPLPFFNWLYRGDGIGGGVCCQRGILNGIAIGNYSDFEYKVLKPKNK